MNRLRNANKQIEHRVKLVHNETVSYYWRQDWFKEICLAAVLCAILFAMLVSISIVVLRPVPIDSGSNTINTGHNSLAVKTITNSDFEEDILTSNTDNA